MSALCERFSFGSHFILLVVCLVIFQLCFGGKIFVPIVPVPRHGLSFYFHFVFLECFIVPKVVMFNTVIVKSKQ